MDSLRGVLMRVSSVVPGDDDLVVVPVVDVAEVRDDRELELLRLPGAADVAFHPGLVDDESLRALSADQPGHPADHHVGVVLLDRVDDRPAVVVLLQVHADHADAGTGGGHAVSFSSSPWPARPARRSVRIWVVAATPSSAMRSSMPRASALTARSTWGSRVATTSVSSARLAAPCSGSASQAVISASSQRRWSANQLSRCCATRL